MKYYVTCKHKGGVFEMLLNFVQINCASCPSSAGKGSDSESFQLAVLIIWLGQNNVGCNKHFDPRESR